KAIPFLLIPVLTRYLSPGDYGVVSMFTVLVALTIPLTGFNGHSAILRSYYKKKIDLPAYIYNALLILVGSSSIVLVCYWLFGGFISTYSGFPEDWLLYVVLVAVSQFIINV